MEREKYTINAIKKPDGEIILTRTPKEGGLETTAKLDLDVLVPGLKGLSSKLDKKTIALADAGEKNSLGIQYELVKEYLIEVIKTLIYGLPPESIAEIYISVPKI